jgi:hypothetical protein
MLSLLETGTASLGDTDRHIMLDGRHPSGEHPEVATCAALLLWLKRAFLHHWDGKHVVESSTVPATALGMLEFAMRRFSHSETWRTELKRMNQSGCIFAMPVVSARIDFYQSAQVYERERTTAAYIYEFDFPFSVSEKALYFRSLCYQRMRKAHSASKSLRELSISDSLGLQTTNLDPELKDLEEHYLLLNVSRQNALKDAMDQLWQREANELRRPLRVRLGQMDGFEVGHDLGGVQTEFFNLVCKQLCNEDMQMFTTDSRTGLSYFRPGSLQPLHMFELCGVLFGIALHNGIPLAISLPFAFYDNLLGVERAEKLKLGILRDGWPEHAKSLLAIWQGEGADLDAVFPLEANGLRLSVVAYDNLDSEDGRFVLEIVDATRIDHHDNSGGADGGSANEKDRVNALTLTPADINGIEKAWPGWRLKWTDIEPSELSSSIVEQ